MRKIVLAAALLSLAGIAQAGELDISHCKFPEMPVVPDGSTASEAEMGQAGAEVRSFVAGTQSSLECLAATEAEMEEELTAEQQAQLVALYNAGVDQMTAVAENYNAQVREFNARE
ncbi:MAG: hypothetical protein ACNA7W_06280 [Pseudomonadales bacterium]